jgi:AcrR family transcriptional regulator
MPPKGKRSKAGERTRAAILDSAIRILGRDGPDRFSASVLAKESGVSKATLFHHFRAIDEIPMLAMERFWTQSLAAEKKDTASARAYLLQLGEQILGLPRQRAILLKAHIVFLVKAMFEPRLHVRLAEGAEAMHGRMVSELAARLPKRLKPAEVEATTRMVEMTLDGLMMSIAATDSPEARILSRRAWETFVLLLLKDMKS